MIDASLLSRVQELSPRDRLELISVVWGTLDHDTVPVSQTERDLLDARLRDLEDSPGDQSVWEDALQRLGKLGS